MPDDALGARRVGHADQRGGARPWNRLETDGDASDDAQRSLGADEQVFQVVAGAGLQHAGEVGKDSSVGQHRLKAEHAVAHRAVAEGHDAAGIGGNHAANGGAAARGKVDAGIEPMHRQRFL